MINLFFRKLFLKAVGLKLSISIFWSADIFRGMFMIGFDELCLLFFREMHL